ncbi:MAG: alpha/beta hydrolase [Paracoccaceae bacterium]|jgi:pimeloyl-ACP methyl ester carboxylesterase|nr:alpha/beta hydrolase [Paracoccaceae bacterium]MDP7184951.1 alpha/beta hydrolase [Paracoccaceae bacterium]
MPQFLDTQSGRRIAFHKTEGQGPTVVFLGGFMSDMEGSKAIFLEDWARHTGHAYLRLDYSGHGQSSGSFTEGSIGDWFADAREVIEARTAGDLILVGSSMGGWISLLLAREMAHRIKGLITIAAAPDFTEDSMFAGFDDAQKAALDRDGIVYLPSDYGDPYPITKRLIEEARNNLVMRSPMRFGFPVRMLQGTEDTAVTRETALRLLDHIEAEDMRLTFVKGGDHSLSTPENLALIRGAIDGVLPR